MSDVYRPKLCPICHQDEHRRRSPGEEDTNTPPDRPPIAEMNCGRVRQVCGLNVAEGTRVGRPRRHGTRRRSGGAIDKPLPLW